MIRPTTRLAIQCPECEGRAFVLPNVHLTETGDSPPATKWCDNCKAQGIVPTREGQRILAFLAQARDLGWIEDAEAWPYAVSWPETGEAYS